MCVTGGKNEESRRKSVSSFFSFSFFLKKMNNIIRQCVYRICVRGLSAYVRVETICLSRWGVGMNESERTRIRDGVGPGVCL